MTDFTKKVTKRSPTQSDLKFIGLVLKQHCEGKTLKDLESRNSQTVEEADNNEPFDFSNLQQL